MEKTSKIMDIDLLQASLNNRPCDSHTEDHQALWSSLKIVLVIVKKLEDLILNAEDKRKEERQAILDMHNTLFNINNYLNDIEDNADKLAWKVEDIEKKQPKIITMQKKALLTDGDNVVDTVILDSWRYLMVKSITPVDCNEYAKLDKTFGREEIEVDNNEYDVTAELGTNTEWKIATMSVCVDLLFIKY